MKLNIIGVFITLLSLNYVQAQENYDTAKIPAELLKNSTIVVRNEEQTFTVKSQSSAVKSYKKAITILSKNGEDYAVMSEAYDNLSSLYNIKATMYDSKGVKIKSYKSTDFKDQSISSSGNMYDSYRLKRLVFLNPVYPYTIEYSYEKSYNGFLGYPEWGPVSSYDCAVEKSSYILQLPQDVTFRYLKSAGLKTDSVLAGNKLTYTWKCENIPSFEYEPMSTGLQNITPWVMASPDKFEYDNSKGSVDNWKNLGLWVYQLSADVQTLPESTKATIKTLVAAAKTDKEKIAILYRYLQSNTRYVNISLGIGGFKPIAAQKVANVNYGDCKALSNYMKTLLAEAGIKSNLVVLGADMPSLKKDFSSFGQANHMILCIPSNTDTTWLECTSQYKPVGFLGSSTANKTVLLITEAGGQLVKTPVYRPEDNYQNRVTSVLLSEEGNAEIKINTLFGSAQYDDNLNMMLIEPTDQRKSLMNRMDVPNMEILSATFTQPDKGKPELEEHLLLKSSQMMSQGGDKLFLTLNLLNRKESVPRKVENRKTSFALPYGFKDMDEISYTLPKGYKVEFVPKDILLESEFGKYTANITVKDNTIIYKRTQLINSNTYGPEKYKSLVDFYKKIYLADKQKAILAKVN